jgi:hypothetical protein
MYKFTIQAAREIMVSKHAVHCIITSYPITCIRRLVMALNFIVVFTSFLVQTAPQASVACKDKLANHIPEYKMLAKSSFNLTQPKIAKRK